MLLYLYFLLAGCLCHSSADIPKITVLQHKVATLPCPHVKGRVTWSRYISGEKVNLVTVENGIRKVTDQRYSSLDNNSLVIRDVTFSDTTTYLCNGIQVYLEVTTDPNMVVPSAGEAPVTQRNDGLGFGLGPDQKILTADTENQQPSDFWKVSVGVVLGAVLVLLVIFTLKLCSKKRTERNADVDKTVTDVIYEEIEAGPEHPGRESYFESPYYWTSVSETPSTSTPSSNHLYSTVNKLTAKGRISEECVYSLAQHPAQAGNVGELSASSCNLRG
ncbi:uncharacterized protein LOC125886381 [Epinephelus fuscoguttatus]|uniref:uncharacterized protein LOC125886381 n=1 Tax=Epinephelus fuscoguttatus TaxID=293821 RepID=UPI0020D1DD44|nr:uncharacterized protein LOC125886381 [Epinephelus fuscoguttatus]